MPEFQIPKQASTVYRTINHHIESTIPHHRRRWISFLIIVIIFYIRIFAIQGFYVVAYALSIYLLNVFLMFLSPKIDPASLSVEIENDPMDLFRKNIDSGLVDEFSNSNNLTSTLPSLPSETEFRPFVRRLPEFKAFTKAMTATTICLFLTFFSFLDIPVYWPILVFYFISLTLLTLRKQVEHMVRYRYVPWDFGKKGEYK